MTRIPRHTRDCQDGDEIQGWWRADGRQQPNQADGSNDPYIVRFGTPFPTLAADAGLSMENHLVTLNADLPWKTWSAARNRFMPGCVARRRVAEAMRRTGVSYH
ncbi:hypothetical protein GCM10009608_34980 [Pseudonocardia alaniniphila]